MKTLQVEVQQDIIEKLSKGSPILAISELVWNSFDADATKVQVALGYNGLDTLESITVKDNGHGLPLEEAETCFRKLGDSWKKRSAKSKTDGRYLHGKEGRGRFRALTLGRIAKWNVVYKRGNQFWEYDIQILNDNIREVTISDEKKSDAMQTGVTVEILEPHKNFKALESEKAIEELSEIFALYLKNYKQIVFLYETFKIDPTPFIQSTHTVNLADLQDETGKKFPVTLEIIEWKNVTKRNLFLCNENGFPLLQLEDARFHTGRFNFTGYLKSQFIEQLSQNNILDLGNLSPHLARTLDETYRAIKDYFLSRAAEEAKHIVAVWKEENVYPYETDPATKVEEVERKVFDIVAVNINENLPDFSDASPKAKKLNLRLLRQSIENNPEDLQLILNEVFNLPKKKQKELADLLQNTTLTSIINASKLVTDRLKFITGLEEIVFDTELKKHVKERTQLHQILKDFTWIFGEEFNLSVSDQSLTEVLKKHKSHLGEEIIIDEPVKRIDGSRGIIDLMFSRQIKTNRDNELEHLIIELKAPNERLGANECSQIESYAFAISEDERFRNINTRWTFWLVSNDLDKAALKRSSQDNRPKGIIHQSERGQYPEITIWVKTWSQIILENKTRLKFIREKLEYQADKGEALKMLHETYSNLWDETKAGKILKEKIA